MDIRGGHEDMRGKRKVKAVPTILPPVKEKPKSLEDLLFLQRKQDATDIDVCLKIIREQLHTIETRVGNIRYV